MSVPGSTPQEFPVIPHVPCVTTHVPCHCSLTLVAFCFWFLYSCVLVFVFPGELEHPVYWRSYIPLGESVSLPVYLVAQGGCRTEQVILGLRSCRHSLL